MTAKENILVIKLSALGDFVQALGPMAAIRKNHPDAHITLLTTKPYQEFGERCGYFNEVLIDKRPKFYDFTGWLNLRKRLLGGNFARVYDLQNNDRSCFYFNLFTGQKPEWVGVAKGASHRNTSPERTEGHAFDGHKQTLELAGIKDVEVDTLDWVEEDLSEFPLDKPFILFVPGSAPQHTHKRWPAENYGKLAAKLSHHGYQIVIIGSKTEKTIAETIIKDCPDALNLTGKTTLFQVAALGKQAAAAIGNDTGPMHIIGPTGCPSMVLFSGTSNPKRHAPKGAQITVLQEDKLEDLEMETVLKKLYAATEVDEAVSG